MTRLSAPVVTRSLPLLALGAIMVGAAASPFTLLVPGVAALPGAMVWAGVLIGAAVLAGGAWALSRRYPRVDWDEAAGALLVRGARIPLGELREVRRGGSASPSAVYFDWRFAPVSGPAFHILVAGRPIRGLDAEGLQAMRRLVEALPEPEPDPGDDGRMLVSLAGRGRAAATGRAGMLAELDAHLGAGGSRAVAATRPEPDPALQEAWAEDDRRAAEAIAAGTRRELRRQRGWTRAQAVAMIVAVAAMILLVGANTFDIPLDHRLDTFAGVLMLFGLVGIAGFAGLRAAAGDAVRRRIRRLADAWWAAADGAERERGLPKPFLANAYAGAASSSRIAGVFTIVAGIVLCVGALAAAGTDSGTAVGRLGFGVAGAVLIAAGIAWIAWAHRATSRIHAEARARAGLRAAPAAVAVRGRKRLE